MRGLALSVVYDGGLSSFQWMRFGMCWWRCASRWVMFLVATKVVELYDAIDSGSHTYDNRL